jgi:hypothetical protein
MESLMARMKKERCLTCPREAKTRGLCGKCYQAAYRALRNATTKQINKAIEDGLIKPSKRGGVSDWRRKAAELAAV